VHYPIGPECILHPSPEVHADDEAYGKRNANVEGIVQEATPLETNSDDKSLASRSLIHGP